MKRGRFLIAAFSLFNLNALSKAFSGLINKGFKVIAGDSRNGRHLKMKGVTMNVLDLKISSADTDGAIAVFEQTGFTPKGGPPLHIHLYQDEFLYVIEGEYLFQFGDERHRLVKGDTIFLPKNIPHAFIQLTEKAKVIVSFLPAGKMEDFFKNTDSWTSPPTNEEIIKLFADHDMKVVGPSLKETADNSPS